MCLALNALHSRSTTFPFQPVISSSYLLSPISIFPMTSSHECFSRFMHRCINIVFLLEDQVDASRPSLTEHAYHQFWVHKTSSWHPKRMAWPQHRQSYQSCASAVPSSGKAHQGRGEVGREWELGGGGWNWQWLPLPNPWPCVLAKQPDMGLLKSPLAEYPAET